MKIGVLGSGVVGRTLADGFLKHGHTVMWASRDTSKLTEWLDTVGGEAAVGTFEKAAAWAEVVVLAVKGTAAEDVVRAIGANIAGKTVIDTTNPIAADPPEDGVLRYFTTYEESLMERLQRLAPDARFVKCFSCVGNALMVDPALPGGRPTMFICGDDERAKEQVKEILMTFGWDHEDLGRKAAARAIEPLCILWCIPGFLRGHWTHAYKVLRPEPSHRE